MNILFHKMRTGKKGQIAVVLTMTLVLFIIAAFIVVNFGKNRLQDNRIKNAAQAGVLAGGSSACVLLNSMANLNDQMILNFAGFTLMMQFLIISWIVDYVRTGLECEGLIIIYNYASWIKLGLGMVNLALTTAAMILMIQGATLVGGKIKDMIDELNAKLPKNSRDSARQYAFSNAGVDEPKIPFSKSGCADAWCYSLIETKFDEFMRLLPAKNKLDLDYGTSLIEFDWNDSRSAQIINNKISVIVTPVQEVPYQLYRYEDVGNNPGPIKAYLGTQDLGILGPVIKAGVNTISIIIALIHLVGLYIAGFAVVLELIALELAMIATGWSACCPTYAAAVCCPAAAYYWLAAAVAAAAGIAAGVMAAAYFNAIKADPPGKIPCFVWDKKNQDNSYPIEVTVRRTTNPSMVDYGIYKTNWPVQSQKVSGTVKDGAIFPPRQRFDIVPNF